VGERRGRSVVYALHDHHVAELLDQAVYHVEHLRLGISDAPEGAEPPGRRTGRTGARTRAAGPGV
jgi:hypothetical protein